MFLSAILEFLEKFSNIFLKNIFFFSYKEVDRLWSSRIAEQLNEKHFNYHTTNNKHALFSLWLTWWEFSMQCCIFLICCVFWIVTFKEPVSRCFCINFGLSVFCAISRVKPSLYLLNFKFSKKSRHTQ